jgi:hypothetical protein
MTKTLQSLHASDAYRLPHVLAASVFAALVACAAPAAAAGDDDDPGPGAGHGRGARIQWVNHFDLLPGCPEITTSYRSTSSGIGLGLTGLVMASTTAGDTCADNGNKVVQMALELAEDTRITGVRLCYESSDAAAYVDQIRLAQVQDPPATALVMLDDPTPLTDPGPVCVDSAKTSINSSKGSVLLSLRARFGDPAGGPLGRIVVRALGLYVK